MSKSKSQEPTSGPADSEYGYDVPASEYDALRDAHSTVQTALADAEAARVAAVLAAVDAQEEIVRLYATIAHGVTTQVRQAAEKWLQDVRDLAEAAETAAQRRNDEAV